MGTRLASVEFGGAALADAEQFEEAAEAEEAALYAGEALHKRPSGTTTPTTMPIPSPAPLPKQFNCFIGEGATVPAVCCDVSFDTNLGGCTCPSDLSRYDCTAEE